jgi:TonB family protein
MRERDYAEAVRALEAARQSAPTDAQRRTVEAKLADARRQMLIARAAAERRASEAAARETVTARANPAPAQPSAPATAPPAASPTPPRPVAPSPPATPIEPQTPVNLDRLGKMVRRGVPPPKLHDVPAVYPTAAQAAGLRGIVIVEVTIDRAGNVVRTKLMRAVDPQLAEAAQAAIRQWKYAPTVDNGEAVAVVTTVTVNFGVKP